MIDYFNPPNSIWPNGMKDDPDGYAVFYPLGTNKVDISTVTWPKGDKLISPFVYQNDELVGFVDTKAITVSGTATTTMNYKHIEADFASISEGKLTINAPNATVKKFTWAVTVDSGNSGDTSSLGMKYAKCTSRAEMYEVEPNGYEEVDIIDGVWNESLQSLIDANPSDNTSTGGLFSQNKNLVSFTSDLSSLTDGEGMFYECTNLTSFSAKLDSLTSGYDMFYGCSSLVEFTSDLSSMTSAQGMFSGCTSLTTFISDLSSLSGTTNGMFNQCKNLTTFKSNLSSLQYPGTLFVSCKLSPESVKNIIETIPTSGGMFMGIGIGCENTTEDKDLFAQEAGYTNMSALLNSFKDKNWSVLQIACNGRPSTTYSLRKPTSGEVLPVYTRLVEDEEYGNYTSIDETKKYRIEYFHITNGSTEGYIQFNTLEEAIEHFNIKPIERN